MLAKKAHKQKGFTLAEVLITLLLTSVAITLSYGTLGYLQALYQNVQQQNRFINQATTLKVALEREFLHCQRITEETPNHFTFYGNIQTAHLLLLEHCLVYQQGLRSDTFNLKAEQVKKAYEPMLSGRWNGKLLKQLDFETAFTKQTFYFYFYKHYHASVKLMLENPESDVRN